jgi:hypothetical protein
LDSSVGVSKTDGYGNINRAENSSLLAHLTGAFPQLRQRSILILGQIPRALAPESKG